MLRISATYCLSTAGSSPIYLVNCKTNWEVGLENTIKLLGKKMIFLFKKKNKGKKDRKQEREDAQTGQ